MRLPESPFSPYSLPSALPAAPSRSSFAPAHSPSLPTADVLHPFSAVHLSSTQELLRAARRQRAPHGSRGSRPCTGVAVAVPGGGAVHVAPSGDSSLKAMMLEAVETARSTTIGDRGRGEKDDVESITPGLVEEFFRAKLEETETEGPRPFLASDRNMRSTMAADWVWTQMQSRRESDETQHNEKEIGGVMDTTGAMRHTQS
jgi:hypothetical protein